MLMGVFKRILNKPIDCRTLVMRRVIVVWDATPQARLRGRSPFALGKKVVQDETTMTRLNCTGHWLRKTYGAGLFCI